MKPRMVKLSHVALVVPVVALVAACGAHATGSPAARAHVSKAAPAATPVPAVPGSVGSLNPSLDFQSSLDASERAPAASGGGSAATNADAGADDPTIEGRDVISEGQISLRTQDINATRFDLVKALDTYDGSIASENSSGDDHGRTERDRLELRVPSKYFADAMDAIAKLGTLGDRSSTSTDVTTKVIDVNTRVRTQKLSLARVQALLGRATSIDEIIRIEGQVARRQADLDSLEQQQKYLADQTALSTITVYLTVPAKKKPAAVTHHHKTHHTFLTGLDAGWGSLTSLTTNVLTGVGAALPYGAVVAALVLVVRVSRRRRVSAR